MSQISQMWKLAIVIAHFFSTVTPTTVPSSYATKYILISWCIFLQIGSGGFLKKKILLWILTTEFRVKYLFWTYLAYQHNLKAKKSQFWHKLKQRLCESASCHYIILTWPCDLNSRGLNVSLINHNQKQVKRYILLSVLNEITYT